MALDLPLGHPLSRAVQTPNPNGLVSAASDDVIRRYECDAVDIGGMTDQPTEDLNVRLPLTDQPALNVLNGAGRVASGIDGGLGAAKKVPDEDATVVGAGREEQTVVREGTGADEAIVVR